MKLLKILAIILAALWFAACTHTGSPEKTKPKREETSESRTTSKDTAESKPQEAQEKSQTSQAASQDSDKAKQQEVQEKPETSRTASQDADKTKQEETQENTADSRTTSSDPAESKPQEIQKKPLARQTASLDTTEVKPEETGTNKGAGRATTSKEANSKLKEARENLRISEETEKRIASELDQIKESGNASAEEINDYEIYHESVQAMVAENRKIVEKMEDAYAKHSPDDNISSVSDSGALETLLDPTIPEEQTQDEVAALDRRLNASLSEFDEKLLREMDAIRAESADKMRDLAQEAAEAAKRLRESGVEVDTSDTQAKEKDEQDQGEESKTGKEAESEKSTSSTQTASRDQSRKSGQGSTREEQRRRNYEDDDIVARQLREAAENETDPELKEKLWKEYEDYKKSTQWSTDYYKF